MAPNTPVDVPLPNRELPVCAPKAGVVLPNGLAPNGLLACALVPNGFVFEPNGLAVAGAPKGLRFDAPKGLLDPNIAGRRSTRSKFKFLGRNYKQMRFKEAELNALQPAMVSMKTREE